MGEDLKYKVGDIVYSKTWQRNVIIQEIIPGGFYKVGDIHDLGWFTEHEDNLCKVKPTCKIDSALNTDKIVLDKVNTLKTQSDNMETETHRGYYTTDVETSNESKKVAWFTFKDNDFADKVELDLSNRELILEDGKWFVVKKKKEYPNTYEECCKVLEIDNTAYLTSVEEGYWNDYELSLNYLIEHFRKLIICRDAYWKIYGEEMGLGDPWEPDFTNDDEERYGIYTAANKVVKDFCGVGDVNTILTFPTAEMRDVFFNAFGDDIENCKELI